MQIVPLLHAWLVLGATVKSSASTFSSSTQPLGFKKHGWVVAAASIGACAASVAYCGAVKESDRKNQAFLFIKPHAVTGPTKTLVEDGLKSKGINILSEGELTAKEIDERMLIDNHYYAIASKATILKPNQLNVNPELFKKSFGFSLTACRRRHSHSYLILC